MLKITNRFLFCTFSPRDLKPRKTCDNVRICRFIRYFVNKIHIVESNEVFGHFCVMYVVATHYI